MDKRDQAWQSKLDAASASIQNQSTPPPPPPTGTVEAHLRALTAKVTFLLKNMTTHQEVVVPNLRAQLSAAQSEIADLRQLVTRVDSGVKAINEAIEGDTERFEGVTMRLDEAEKVAGACKGLTIKLQEGMDKWMAEMNPRFNQYKESMEATATKHQTILLQLLEMIRNVDEKVCDMQSTMPAPLAPAPTEFDDEKFLSDVGLYLQ